MTEIRDARAINRAVDAVYDHLLAALGCEGTADAHMVSHWQDTGTNPGFRICITRKSDGRTATRFVNQAGKISV